MTTTSPYLKLLPCIAQDFCTCCRLCSDTCLSGAVTMEEGQTPNLTRPQLCLSDARCANTCPMGGIEMSWVALEANHSIGQWRMA